MKVSNIVIFIIECIRVELWFQLMQMICFNSIGGDGEIRLVVVVFL